MPLPPALKWNRDLPVRLRTTARYLYAILATTTSFDTCLDFLHTCVGNHFRLSSKESKTRISNFHIELRGVA